MSKNKRTLIILAAITAAIIAVIAVILLTAPEESVSSEDDTESVSIYSISASDFVRASVTNELGGFTLEKTENGYAIPEDDGFELSTYSTGWLGDKLIAPNATKVIEEPNELSEYGLDKPSAACRVELADGSVKTLLLGNESVTAGYYMMLEGEKNVYIVTNNLPAYLMRAAAWYVEADVIPSASDCPQGTDTTVKYVFMGGKARAENVEIQMDPSYVSTDTEASTPYIMTQPVSYPVNTSTSGDLISYAPALKFSECADIRLDAEKLAKYGLDDPDYVLKYRFANFDVHIDFADAGEYYYAVLEGFDAVFIAYPGNTSFLSTPAEEYMSRLTFTKPLSSLSGLKISVGGKQYAFRIDHNENGTVPYCGSLKLDETNFKQFYENMIMTLSEGRTDEKPTAEAYISFVYSFNDGTPDVKAEFVPIDSMRYVYLVDGDGMFFVLKSQVDALASDIELISQNKPIKTTI